MELSGVVLRADAAGMKLKANSSQKGVSNRRLAHSTATVMPLWLMFPPTDT